MLVPSIHPVRPFIGSAPFSTELVLDRTDKDWHEALDTKYYLYPVHVSLSFMFTPTLASALYLLLLRFLHRGTKQPRLNNRQSAVFVVTIFSHHVCCRLR